MQEKYAHRLQSDEALIEPQDEQRLRQSTITMHPEYDYGEEALLPPVPIYPASEEEPPSPPRSRSRRSDDNVFSVAQLFAIGLVLGMLAGAWEALSERIALAARVPLGELPAESPAPTLPFGMLFGPEAMAACVDSCELGPGPGRAPCIRSCSRLSFTHFGRRVLLEEHTAQTAVDQIERLCTPRVAPAYRRHSPRLWRERAASGIDSLRSAQLNQGAGDAASLSREYTSLKHAALELWRVTPRDVDAGVLHRELLQTICLRTHLTVTALAREIALVRNDSFSQRFYDSLHHSLGPRVLEREAGALQSAERMKLPYELR